MRALVVVNAGSSSLKTAVYSCESGAPSLLLRARVEEIGRAPRFVAEDASGGVLAEEHVHLDESSGGRGDFAFVDAWLRRERAELDIVGCGHRVVHGGDRFAAPVRVDAGVLAQLEELCELAPLHQPHNLAPMREIAAAHPHMTQVACFDTAFHRGRAAMVERFALPERFYERGIRRYGFHGLSYESVAASLPQVAPAVAEGRVIAAHLGNGASLCAMRERRSVDTTMGFTALDGLVMGTRCGSIDPGVLLHLLADGGMNPDELERLLYNESGLLGISGISSDMRELLASPEPSARLAVDMFVHRIVREIGAMAAVLGGLDAIVFTAGIGENSPQIRERICEGCRWLGVEVDEDANAAATACITRPQSRVSAWVVPTDEEGVIAAATAAIL